MDLQAALSSPNVQAFLAVIRHGEGTSDAAGYGRLFGGASFTDFQDHPQKPQTFKLKDGQILTSSAAGAYQILTRTWKGLVAQYGFTDFSPASQDQAAVALIAGRNALADVLAGRLDLAIQKCAKEWASLPGSPYGQPTISLAKAFQIYQDAAGIVFSADPSLPHQPAAPSSPQPVLVDSPQAQPEKKTMPPFLLAALPALLDCVPKLAAIFGDGSKVSDRNIKAVTLAVDVAKATAGAANEQALVESLKDPSTAAAVKAAVEGAWFEISQNGDGIPAARQASAAVSDFWKQPGIWVTVMLMPLVYFVTYKVMTGAFSAEVQSMVIASIISGVLSAVTGFWLGTSFSSARKTELAARQI